MFQVLTFYESCTGANNQEGGGGKHTQVSMFLFFFIFFIGYPWIGSFNLQSGKIPLKLCMYLYISQERRLCTSLLISTLQSLQCAWKRLVYFWISAFSFQFSISHIEPFTGKVLVLPLNNTSFIICVCCIYYAISMSLAAVTIKSIPRITVLIAILYIHHARGYIVQGHHEKKKWLLWRLALHD